MFWRAWNTSLNCTDFNSASLNTWLTNKAKQSITVALSKKCNLFSVYGTCTCGTCFSFTVYSSYSVHFYFLFCTGFAGSSHLHMTHLSPLIPGKYGFLETSCDCVWKQVGEKRSWKYPSWRKGCTFCPYPPEHQRLCMELGANHANVFLWSPRSAMARGMESTQLSAHPSVLRRDCSMLYLCHWTDCVWSVTGASRCCQSDSNNNYARLLPF